MLSNLLIVYDLLLLKKDTNIRVNEPKSKIKINVRFEDADCGKQLAVENHWEKLFSVSLDEILEDTDLCVLAETDGNLIHWTQISFGSTFIWEIQKKIVLNQDCAYLHGIYTLQACRGMGVTSTVINRVSSYLREKGIKEIYILISADNDAMKRIAGNEGFQKIGSVKLTKMWGLKIYKYKGNAKSLLKYA